MDPNQKIHLLSQELLPILDGLDPEPKQIVLEHVNTCRECKDLLSKVADFDDHFPEHEFQEDFDVKPLKKLVQFNMGLKLLLIAVRTIILFYIFYSSFSFYDQASGTLMLEMFQSAVYLFYLPAALFLLVFTYTFFNKKWLWISLAADLFIIVFLSSILRLFL